MPESTVTQTTNKRKRGALDDPASRAAPGIGQEGFVGVEDSAMNQLTAFNSGDVQPNGSGAAPTASDTAAAALHYPIGNDASFQSQASAGDYTDPSYLDSLEKSPTQPQPQPQSGSPGLGSAKPQVGSDEWHKIRKDNHKEVERRRRETINEGINELAKIVPGCEKNKGSILQRAVQYIGQLKENETSNLEKWTLEKLLLDQAINELSSTCDRLKADFKKAWAEREAYKRACEENGLSVEVKYTDETPATVET